MALIIDALIAATSVGFVGSRESTEKQLTKLGMIAGWSAIVGKLGISGGCIGADQMAANKYVEYGKEKNFHVHMPWPQYCAKHVVPEGCTWDCWDDRYNRCPNFVIPSDLKEEMLWIASIHDKRKTEKWPQMMGRNALIVTRSDVLVYCISCASAGTTHDINIAQDIGIPCINVDGPEWKEVYEFLISEKERLGL